MSTMEACVVLGPPGRMTDFLQDTMKREFPLVQVLVAHTASEGLGLLQARSADMLICQWSMPDATAEQLLEALSGLNLSVTTVIVGPHDPMKADQALMLGALDYVFEETVEDELPDTLWRVWHRHVNDDADDADGVMLRDLLKNRITQIRRTADDVEIDEEAFLHKATHELRTPLNAIMGYADALIAEVFGPLNPRQSEAIGRMRSRARDLLALVNNLLDLGSLDAGSVAAHAETCDVAGILHEIKDLGATIADSHQVEMDIIVHCDEALRPVLSDRGLLRQILHNLVANAVKYAGRGELILYASPMADKIMIVVKDEGPGIPVEDQERIFQEFVQLEPTHQHALGGNGLGLAIARRYATLLGGSLDVESAPGRGAAFRLLIPVELPNVNKSLRD